MNKHENAAPLWLQLVLVFTLPAWLPLVPVVPAARRWRARRAARVDVADTLPLMEFFAA